MRYVVESIDNCVARLEDETGASLFFSVSSLPAGAADGTCLRTEGGLLVPDPAYEHSRRRQLYDLQQRLKSNRD